MATVPSPEDVEAAIMGGAGRYVKRPGDTFPYHRVGSDLQQNEGFMADELNDALGRLIERGWLEKTTSGVLIRVTDEGFKEI